MTKTAIFAKPPIGTFKAILWKELCENLKWAVIGMLGMAAGLTYKLNILDEQLRGGNSGTDAVSFLFEATVAGGALVGLLIGGAQTLPENRGDKWGFLAHRPVSRSTLFWGKASSGILLYSIATGLPLAGALLWMSWPGHLPIPFDWRFTLPGLADLLYGLVYYFAGFLTGMREARWYGSRALGIGAAVACFALQTGATEFWQAAAASAVGMLVVGTAARSTFVAGGRYETQTRTGRAAVAISVGLGITVVGVFVLSFVMNFLEPRFEPRTTEYTVTTDGAVVKTVSQNNEIVAVSDLQGHPLERYQNSSARNALGVEVLSAEPSPLRIFGWRYRSTERIFNKMRPAGSDYNRGPVSWYYVHRFNLIAAYENQSGRLLGWMGPDGFSQGDAMPRPFEGPLKNPQWYGNPQALLMFENAVYRLDLDQRQVEEAFVPQPEEVIVGVDVPHYTASTLATYGDLARFEVISTTKRVIVQLRDGTTLLDVPHDPNAKGYVELHVYRPMRAPGMPTFLWYRSYSRNAAGERQLDQVSKFDAAGTVTEHYALPETGLVWRTSQAQTVILSAIAPLGAQVIADIAGAIRRARIGNAGAGFRPLQITSWVVAGLASLISAFAVFSRGRTYAFSPRRLRFWIGVALVLGPLVFFMMLALIEWPALERCPACGKKRVVTLEHCEHCREPFAPPTMDGTEIFEN